MNVDYFRTLYAYHHWANHRIWKCIETLTDTQFIQDVGYSWGSVRGQTVHQVSTDARWLARLRGTSVPDSMRDEDYPTKAALRARWDEVENDWVRYIESLDEAQLMEVIAYTTRSGGDGSSARWQILSHVVNHGTDHRAQILAALAQLGAPTADQDLMFYYWGLA